MLFWLDVLHQAVHKLLVLYSKTYQKFRSGQTISELPGLFFNEVHLLPVTYEHNILLTLNLNFKYLKTVFDTLKYYMSNALSIKHIDDNIFNHLRSITSSALPLIIRESRCIGRIECTNFAERWIRLNRTVISSIPVLNSTSMYREIFYFINYTPAKKDRCVSTPPERTLFFFFLFYWGKSSPDIPAE